MHAPVEAHAQVQVRNILLGDHDRRIDGDLRREAFARRSQARAACLGFHDRLFQHGLVKFEPDFLDMPGLLVTDQIARAANRSEEHTSELQSLMRISYAVFCLKKKKS